MNAPLRLKLHMMEDLDRLVESAVWAATKEYAAQSPGGVTGGSGGLSGQNSVLRRFTKSNTHGFAPLNPRYAKAKRRRFGVKPILVRTGMLREAVRRSGLVTVQRGRARVVFRLPDYGRFHEQGTARMPRRSPVQPNAEDRAAWASRVRQALQQLIKRRAAI
jgi:hypothetical protein